MVGILVSFWDGLFSGAMLVSGRVVRTSSFPKHISWKKNDEMIHNMYQPGFFLVDSLPKKNTCFMATNVPPSEIRL